MPPSLLTEEADAALKKSTAQYEDWVKSLEEQKRRLAYLQAVEKQFLATRDINLLEEFRDKREIPEAELAEKVKKPCAIWREDGWLEEVRDDSERLAIRQRMLDEQDADARLLNPNVKIRHIKGKEDSHIYSVYEGIDGKKFVHFKGCAMQNGKQSGKLQPELFLARQCIVLWLLQSLQSLN